VFTIFLEVISTSNLLLLTANQQSLSRLSKVSEHRTLKELSRLKRNFNSLSIKKIKLSRILKTFLNDSRNSNILVISWTKMLVSKNTKIKSP
jgi:hypothetical protein